MRRTLICYWCNNEGHLRADCPIYAQVLKRNPRHNQTAEGRKEGQLRFARALEKQFGAEPAHGLEDAYTQDSRTQGASSSSGANLAATTASNSQGASAGRLDPQK